MKAVQILKFGGPDVIEIVDIEKPKIDKSHILVKVYSSSINPVDYKIREGMIPNMKFPFTLGSDVAGVVTEIGEGVENFSIGNNVYGSGIVLAGATGAFAEFVVIPAGLAAKMPKNLDFNQAAAVVLTGVSAVQALLEHFKLQPKQKILIHGGAGGIGTMAIQIAKSMGAYVATTATGSGIGHVKKLGADRIIDYQKENFEELLLEYDAVFDTVGSEAFEKSFAILKKGGIIVSMVAQDEKNLANQHGVTAISQFTKVNTERLDALTKLIENKKVKVYIDKIYTLDNIKEAFKEQEKGDVLGKVVIQIVNS